MLEPNALKSSLKEERGARDLPRREAGDEASNSYFQPASLNLLAYSLPMSPMPIMPTEITSISTSAISRRHFENRGGVIYALRGSR